MFKESTRFARSYRVPRPFSYRTGLALIILIVFLSSLMSYAQLTAVSLQSPRLQDGGSTNVISPIHVQATAEDRIMITGYVVYLDDQNVFRNFSQSVDAWIVIPPGPHSLYVKAWDSSGSNMATPRYQINVTGFAPPSPPIHADRLANIDNGQWTVDNNLNVGGQCNHGSIGAYASQSDPNTANSPTRDGNGQHFILKSGCGNEASQFVGDTNFLWDFWFYIPSTTNMNTVQAMEFDLFQAIQFSDGVHEFMFGSQCNVATNQWQLWLPAGRGLTWVNAGVSPCRFSTGEWHHATYFVQRVTSNGYQEIPKAFGPSTDKNTNLRFGTLTIDGETSYLGGVAWSTIPTPVWGQTLGVQHQLDSSVAGVTIEEYTDHESLTMW